MSDYSKFKGTYKDLKEVVQETRIMGEWESKGIKKTYRTWENGILNWWETTKIIHFQGQPDVRTALMKAFHKAVLNRIREQF